jgi:SAM-dependent methyltransferase
MRRVLQAARSAWRAPLLWKANRLMAAGRRGDAFRTLRRLPTRGIGELLLDVPARFGALRAALPRMPAEEVQRAWTGNAGRVLLAQTCAFVDTIEAAFTNLCGRGLQGATILDYGCGWGRILRIMYRYSAPESLYGVDPWPESLEICRATGLLGNLARCEEVPQDLPFAGATFDLVYAFSVLTHLSESTAAAVVGAIRRRIAPGGLLALTVRPVEYWALHSWFPDGTSAEAMRARHQARGFAFIPHLREPIDGQVTFGDASISLAYIRQLWSEWDVAGHTTNAVDPYQTVVFLKPR